MGQQDIRIEVLDAVKGRGVIANGDISAGSEIYPFEKALCATLSSEYISTRCSNCFRGREDTIDAVDMLFQCSRCHCLQYCSKVK